MLKDKLTLDEVVDLLPPAAGRGVQLERPQEVGGVLEVGSNGQNLRTETRSAQITIHRSLLQSRYVRKD